MKRVYEQPETEVVRVELDTFIAASPTINITDKTTTDVTTNKDPGGLQSGGVGTGDDMAAKRWHGGVSSWTEWD